MKTSVLIGAAIAAVVAIPLTAQTAAVALRNFRGRDPKVDAYLRDKGFPVRVPS